MAKTAAAKKTRSVSKTTRQDPVEAFGRRLGGNKKLMVSFAIDPWLAAAKNGVPKQYVEALRQYEEKLLRTSMLELNASVKEKGVRPIPAAGELPADIKSLATNRGWELRFVKVERTVLGKKILLGYKLVINDNLAKDIANGIAVIDALGAFFAAAATTAGIVIAATPGLKEAMLVLGAALLLQAALINLMNKGQGVYYFTSYWIVLNLIAFGPAGLTNAWVGPLPN
jgi:hypothetical protein